MLQNLATILYLSGDPITISSLAKILVITEDEILKLSPSLEALLGPLGLTLLNANGSLSIVTRPEQAALLETFWKDELKGDLTPAALQVLTLVAYLGDGTREQISYIRGVQSSQTIRTLTVRGLITRNGEVCLLTIDSLKQLGITKVEDLPEYETVRNQLIEKLEIRNA